MVRCLPAAARCLLLLAHQGVVAACAGLCPTGTVPGPSCGGHTLPRSVWLCSQFQPGHSATAMPCSPPSRMKHPAHVSPRQQRLPRSTCPFVSSSFCSQSHRCPGAPDAGLPWVPPCRHTPQHHPPPSYSSSPKLLLDQAGKRWTWVARDVRQGLVGVVATSGADN